VLGQNDLGRSPSEYGETQLSARRTDVMRLKTSRTGANLAHHGFTFPYRSQKTRERPV